MMLVFIWVTGCYFREILLFDTFSLHYLIICINTCIFLFIPLFNEEIMRQLRAHARNF